MRLLLDTHTLLWALTEPKRLSTIARNAVASPSNELVVSAASAWEIATKHRLGRLPQADALIAAYPQHLDRLGAQRLPVSELHALTAGRLEWDHRDPFDRILAAQGMLESLTLVTNDPPIIDFTGVRTLW